MSSADDDKKVMHVAPALRVAAEAAPVMPVVTTPEASARGLQHFVRTGVSPYVSRQIQRVGHTGVAGMGLLVFALAFFAGANLPLKTELAGLQTNVATANHARAESAAHARPSPELEARAFTGRLPPRSELPRITEKIVASATAAGIVLDRGAYDFSITPSKRLVRARMTFPVHGKYRAIRRFVDSTLATIPDAAVDGLRLQRKDIGATDIDAEVRFAIYLRSSP